MNKLQFDFEVEKLNSKKSIDFVQDQIASYLKDEHKFGALVKKINENTCTFAYTGKTRIKQDYYQCKTCNLKNGFGVCIQCSKVCHKFHDLIFIKNKDDSDFFCDCGTKEYCKCKLI